MPTTMPKTWPFGRGNTAPVDSGPVVTPTIILKHEAEVKAATAANAADPSVKEYVDKIQKVFKVLSGDDGPPVEIPAHVTPEKILEMMEKICKRCVH